MDLATAHDALRLHLSGAHEDGGAQSRHCLSLGGYRSATEADGLGVNISHPIPAVRIDYAAPANGEGVGALTAVGAGTLAWTPPGGAQGETVAIAEDETKLLPGGDAEKYIRVTRSTANGLEGDAAVELRICPNTAVVGADVVDPDGDTTIHRALFLRNDSIYRISNLQIWIESDPSNYLSIATETPDGQGRIADLSPYGEEVAPDGVSGWSQGQTPAAGLQVGTLAAGDTIGLWMARTVEYGAGVTLSPRTVHRINWQYDIADRTCTGKASGTYRKGRSWRGGYVLYRGVDGPPDFAADLYMVIEPEDFPVETDPQDVGHTYQFVLRKLNKWGPYSRNIKTWTVQVGSGGEEVTLPPGAPTEVTLTPQADGSVLVEAHYARGADDEDRRANYWAVYYRTDGSDPEPGDPGAKLVEVNTADAMPYLDQTLGPYPDGTELRVLVTLRNYVDDDENYAESTNTAVSVATASVGAGITEALEPACCWRVGPQIEPVVELWRYNAGTYIDLLEATGVLRISVGGSWSAIVSSELELLLAGEILYGPGFEPLAQDDLIDVDPVSGNLRLAVGPPGDRWRALELTWDGDLIVADYSALATLPDLPEAGTMTRGVQHVPGTPERTVFAADADRALLVLERQTQNAVLRVRNVIENVVF